MQIYRTRFKKDVVAEFVVPRRPSHKVVILCDGMPSVPSKKSLLEYFWKKGFWVFHPRYRGSWESGGQFLARSPHEDVLDVIDGLKKGFKSVWDGQKFQLSKSKIFIVGSSFGGPAALLCSRDPRVTKVIARSPVVDWTAPSKAEPLDWFYVVVREAFGEAYRVTRKNWNKLKTGKFYNPMAHVKEFDPKKILIIHAKDDEVASFRPVQKFLKKVKCDSIILPTGGHQTGQVFFQKRCTKKTMQFLK